MSSLAMPVTPTTWHASLPTRQWRRRCSALAVALAVHLGLGALLLTQWQVSQPEVPQISTVQLQLLTLAAPAPVQPPEPPALAEPAPAPIPLPVQPAPVVEPPRLEQAALARKRAEQEQREQAQQRLREEQQRDEQRLRREAEARAQQEQQRQAEQRLAEQREQAATAAAERSRQAEATAAASRQYLPIAKQAPSYPQRALDKGLEGQCTVHYTVNAQGRVENPEAESDCHPLFIRPSLNAAKSFRYQPRIIDGRAVAVANVRNTFTYRIEPR
ncbi:MAG: energy transducer TonB [Gammaproteobacteria bacterium]|nr:energy transducer TonB [Gammaproteobacteria bacterium]MBU1492171.1 energy transducer TonB [Gammaproteobacteria bacterium]MBU2140487.1 energy transducer TonB [Gammaproteobacteria bacterium]MBU2325043.1 energy transducer TonB [Gammaproteobacteria bacterium]